MERRSEREAQAHPLLRTRHLLSLFKTLDEPPQGEHRNQWRSLLSEAHLRDPDLGSGEEPCLGTCGMQLGIAQGGTPQIAWLRPPLTDAHEGVSYPWGRVEAEQRSQQLAERMMFLLNMFKVSESQEWRNKMQRIGLIQSGLVATPEVHAS